MRVDAYTHFYTAMIECCDDSRVCIVMVNPRDAFLRDEIEKALGKKVEVEPFPMTKEIIERLLKGERLGTP